MTEEEAKEKWCHMSGDGERLSLCIGSQCMAWVWDVSISGDIYATKYVVSDTSGHCGMVK